MRHLLLGTSAAATMLIFSVAAGPFAATPAHASTQDSASGRATPPGGETIGGSRLASKHIVVDPRAGATPLPEVAAEAYVVADATTGDILAARGAHTPHRPASTLKTLTALTALGQGLDLDTTYTAQYADTAVEGTHVGLVEGSTYTF